MTAPDIAPITRQIAAEVERSDQRDGGSTRPTRGHPQPLHTRLRQTGRAEPPPPPQGPQPPRVPDAEALLSDHVIPALRERGVLGPGDRIRPRDGRNDQPLPPGTVTVDLGASGPDGAAAAEETRSQDGTGDVHVHIDRVEVVRAAPTPVPPAGPAAGLVGPSRLESYLEQRQASGR